jgi:hypothetical protein
VMPLVPARKIFPEPAKVCLFKFHGPGPYHRRG